MPLSLGNSIIVHCKIGVLRASKLTLYSDASGPTGVVTIPKHEFVIDRGHNYQNILQDFKISINSDEMIRTYCHCHCTTTILRPSPIEAYEITFSWRTSYLESSKGVSELIEDTINFLDEGE